ncbi:MAG: tetratricopeptide repeat protein [Cyanobacteria bacterium HKST-UBA02]|nr:tetratricopeptide repeat protein [Cyanobacteria bacterium HKST-UBA02]
MTSNSQISKSIIRTRRSIRRPWLILAVAILLVTVPVLPLKFLGIPGPDLVLSNFYQPLLSNLRSQIALPDKKDQKSARQAMPEANIGLLDRSNRAILKELSESPNDPSLHNRAGLINLELGEYQAAITHFDQAITRARESVRSLRREAESARARGDLDRAAKCIGDISAINVQLAAAHSSLARVYERLGRSDKVIGQMKELDREIALATTSGEDNDTAKKSAESGDPKRLDHETATMLVMANSLRQEGRLKEATDAYKRLIDRAPALAAAHRELALTAKLQHNVWLAEQELEKTIELNPNDATAHNALGDVLMSIGKVDEASKEYLKTMALDPKNALAAYSLGNIYANQGKLSEARQAFQSAVAANPGSAYAHNNLATMCSLSGDYQTAAVEFVEAIKLSPDMASAHYGLGIAQLNLKQYPASIRSFKTALVLNPSLLDARHKIEIAQRRGFNPTRTNVN